MTDNLTIELGEYGCDQDGNPRIINHRLFIQIHVFSGCLDDQQVLLMVEEASRTIAGFEGVLYRDLNDPQGIGLLVAHENPSFFVESLRPFLNRPPFSGLEPRPDFSMIGRTYSIGYETDLENILLDRPRLRMYNPKHTWAVWYPLRRGGSFEQLAPEDQKEILQEHAHLGISFSENDYGQDIRLACHGMDVNDNDFVIGLVGSELYPLSAMVQTMRKTRQTSVHLERLGPFFVGKVLWQSPCPATNPPGPN